MRTVSASEELSVLGEMGKLYVAVFPEAGRCDEQAVGSAAGLREERAAGHVSALRADALKRAPPLTGRGEAREGHEEE